MKKFHKGFSLIEMLVVVLILGMLASIGVPNYMVSVKKSRLGNYIALVKNLKDAEENYFMDRGEFTADLSLLAVSIPPSNGCSFETSNVGSYYNCSDGSRYGIFNNASNAQAGEKDMRYVIVFKDYYDNGVSFKAGDIACMSKGNLARQACKSTGGVEYKGIGWDYITISRSW